MTPEISVIVPIYNAQDYLEACIDSVVGQSFGAWELLLIDDGSTSDRVSAIGRCYAQADPRIRFFSKPNGGVSSARNLGLDQATGRYVAFLDADDIFTPDALERLHEALSASEASCALGSALTLHPDGTTSACLQFAQAERMATEAYARHACFHGACWGYLLRRDRIKALGLRFDTRLAMSEDRLFILRYLLGATAVSVLPDVIYYYRVSPTSAVGSPMTPTKAEQQYLAAAECLKCARPDQTVADRALVGRALTDCADNYLGSVLLLGDSTHYAACAGRLGELRRQSLRDGIEPKWPLRLRWTAGSIRTYAAYRRVRTLLRRLKS